MDSISRPDPRRRPVLSPRSKSIPETFANGNDLSHTIHGEVVLERPRDAPNPKKAPKKHPPKPRWATILSILAKNCLLLAVLLWLGQSIWRWSDTIAPGARSQLDYEGRISELEASMKKTAKMLQVQIEVVDNKIGNGVSGVKKGVQAVEEMGELLGKEMKKLGGRVDHLDESLGELKDKGFVSKAEIEAFWDEFKESDKDVDLDRVRALAREVVEKEIGKHAADGIGRVDYALGSGGGRVVSHSQPYGKANSWFAAAGLSRDRVHGDARKMLEPSFGEPGQCFALQGSAGFVEIRLKAGIIPQAITLEHVAKSVAYDRSSAPKDCQVTAWFEAPTRDPPNGAEKQTHLLAEFSYDLEKSNAQTFIVEAADQRVVNMVRLDFASNHGSPDWTCIYRLRVHGYEPSWAEATE